MDISFHNLCESGNNCLFAIEALLKKYPISPAEPEWPTLKSVRRRQATRGDISQEVFYRVIPKEVYETDKKKSDPGFILPIAILLVTVIISYIS